MTRIVTTSSDTIGDNIVLAANEDLFFAPGAVRTSSTGVGIVATLQGHAMNVLGTVYGETIGVQIGDVGAGSAFSTLTLGADAMIVSHGRGISSTGSTLTIANAGLIQGAEGVIHSTGGGFELVNTGSIVGSFGDGVRVDSTSGSIVNYGTIVGQASNDGVQLINSQGDGAAPTLVNYGFISGTSRAVQGDFSDANSIRNFGEISGSVSAGSGADLVRNAGLISGNLDLGSGDDDFDGRGGTVEGLVSGGSGLDILRGGGGDDTLRGQNDADTLLGGAGDDSLEGGSGNDDLRGNAGNDALAGGPGDDADTLRGGAGDDLYLVDGQVDLIVESASGGLDSVESSGTFVLPKNVELLSLIGAADIDGTGNALDNEIFGNGAANRLDGGPGADTLSGGLGADTYVVDDPGDLVLEIDTPIDRDRVESRISYALGATVEDLVLTGSANINGTGNAAANAIFGNDGNNTLDGGAGPDTLTGGLGDDTYRVDDAGDDLVESAGEGTDLVTSTVTHTLAASIENLALLGSDPVDATGNGLANSMIGNGQANRLDGGSGNDSLSGGGGSDTLLGGVGADTLTGGGGGDRFRFVMVGEGADTLTDFTSTADKIQVVSANFASLPVGTLAANRFKVSGAPLTNGNAVFVYDSGSGALSFDADGNGAGSAVALAVLTGPKVLVASDIQIVAA